MKHKNIAHFFNMGNNLIQTQQFNLNYSLEFIGKKSESSHKYLNKTNVCNYNLQYNSFQIECFINK